MRIKDIAAIAGVSPATVSLVLNNRRGVSAQKRELIKKVLDEHNYYPQHAKRAPKCCIRFIKYTAHGMAVEENQGFIAAIIDRVESECRRHSYNLIMCGCDNTTVQDTLRMVASDPRDGVIVLGTEFDAAMIRLISQIKAPVVVLDNSMLHENVDSVVMANAGVAYTAVSYLYHLGHRYIGYYKTNVNISNFSERYHGYLEALAKLGLNPPEPVMLTPTLQGAYSDMKKLLVSGSYVPRGAVLADNDTIAIGASKALQESGYSIPEDISIIGVDDIPFSSIMVPPLTTIRISRSTMGIQAVKLLTERIKNPDRPFIHLLISGQLQERASTAPAKQ